MKHNHLLLSIQSPCIEQWENFSPAAKGKFCHSCCKEVVDFTEMLDRDIIEYFTKNSSRTCGRFRSQQLKLYPLKNTRKERPDTSWIKIGFLSLPLMLWAKEGYSKELVMKPTEEVVQVNHLAEKVNLSTNSGHAIKGIVKDETGELLPGVNVHLKGSTVGTITDIEGRFEFPELLQPGEVLIFSFVGFEHKEYVVSKNAPQLIEIPMIVMDFDIMGEVAVEGLYQAKSTWWQRIKGLFQ